MSPFLILYRLVLCGHSAGRVNLKAIREYPEKRIMIRTITGLKDIEQFVGCCVQMTVSNHSRRFEPKLGTVGKVGNTIYTLTLFDSAIPVWSVDLLKLRFHNSIKEIEFHVMSRPSK